MMQHSVIAPPEILELIKEHDKISKNSSEPEKNLQNLNKKQYKEELDRQLKEKMLNARSSFTSKNEELEYLKAQNLAIMEFESKQNQEARNYYKLFENKNNEIIQTKMKKKEIDAITSQRADQIRIKKEQDEIEQERFLEKIKREQRIKDERTEHQRQMNEKFIRDQILNLERQREKAMVQKKIEEMKTMESRQSELMKKRLNEFDEKMRKFSPSLEITDKKQILIEKRQQEREKTENEQYALRERIEKESREQARALIKQELDSQVQFKVRVKKNEFLEGQMYQEFAKKEAREVEYKQNLQKICKSMQHN